METGNAAFELADLLAERERSAGIARAQAALRGSRESGPLVCDCGEEIPDARRRAVPGTRRCFDCAALFERLARRRA